jgi:hypothetical protein
MGNLSYDVISVLHSVGRNAVARKWDGISVTAPASSALHAPEGTI